MSASPQWHCPIINKGCCRYSRPPLETALCEGEGRDRPSKQHHGHLRKPSAAGLPKDGQLVLSLIGQCQDHPHLSAARHGSPPTPPLPPQPDFHTAGARSRLEYEVKACCPVSCRQSLAMALPPPPTVMLVELLRRTKLYAGAALNYSAPASSSATQLSGELSPGLLCDCPVQSRV
ncbi:hypothetical protein Micbo1qcDRAFT_67143 [Microdochium bolleyi]|uniref:Uncharacterized protein n=1 Tax=Microdochium bolleyi TaxID=196109 RepID=A0A136J162_9PEZI|nr:hypothetical protein Micbo1qcDRAFT_67143 [Microdochium bolleyi]